jgi:uncharacterized protein YdhG (YjbR/CyaY superfamily)
MNEQQKETTMSPKKVTKSTKKPAKRTSASNKGLSAEEIAAMKETMRERKANLNKEEAEKAVLDKIAEMKGLDHTLAKRIHEIVKANAPTLSPKTWYGMPAYANADGKIVCFFQSAKKFEARYATLGFNDSAKLDGGQMWPTAFALKELTSADEARIIELVKKAVS